MNDVNKKLVDRPSLIVFESGQNGQKNIESGVGNYRIPALLKTKKGTLIAGADQRHNHHYDWGNIDMVIRRSETQGQTWGEVIKICDLATNPKAQNKDWDSAFNIDMCLVQDEQTERIFAIFDMFGEQRGCFGMFDSPIEVAYTKINGVDYLNVYDVQTNQLAGTVREQGIIYNNDGVATEYRVTTMSNDAPYSDLGTIYYQSAAIGNIYFTTNTPSPYRIANNMYIWLSYSDDDGVTWSSPRDITPTIKLPWMKFYGVGPGNGICLKQGTHQGRLVVTVYSTNSVSEGLFGSQSSRVIYSDDHGQAWHSGQSVNDNRNIDDIMIHSSTMNHPQLQNTEATVVQLQNGQLKLLMRNLNGFVQVATSLDDGQTWENDLETLVDVPDAYVQLSAITTVQNNQEYVLLCNAYGPERTNGVIHVLKVQIDGTLQWLKKIDLHSGKFAYNSIQQVSDDMFGVLYECAEVPYNDYCLAYKYFTWQELMSE